VTLVLLGGPYDRFRVIVSERITPEFGVVAIDGSRLVERPGRRRRRVAPAPTAGRRTPEPLEGRARSS
jgi:hypothetical protein